MLAGKQVQRNVDMYSPYSDTNGRIFRSTKAGDDVVASEDGDCAVFTAAPPVATVYSPSLNTKLKSQVYEVPSITTVRNKLYVDLRVCHNAMIP